MAIYQMVNRASNVPSRFSRDNVHEESSFSGRFQGTRRKCFSAFQTLPFTRAGRKVFAEITGF